MSNLVRRSVVVPLAVLMVAGFVLSNVFHSDDPGARGPIADVSFFTFVLLALFLIGLGAAALVRRRRNSA
jgi:MYXO-CTERM domain-containing protein